MLDGRTKICLAMRPKIQITTKKIKIFVASILNEINLRYINSRRITFQSRLQRIIYRITRQSLGGAIPKTFI
ncbi:hypothetical protein WL18_10605 [Burkholderia ubonensis]|nr:hypothetical protein WL18_10605 [Burkholderia ubonensis]